MVMRHQKRVFWPMANNSRVVIVQSVSQNSTMTEDEKMFRAITICIFTVLLFTLGSAAIYTIPHWNDPDPNSACCMFCFDGRSNAIAGGIICGIGGFIVSLIVGPTVAVTDNSIQRYRIKFADHQIQAQSDTLSLLRASDVPSTQQRAELLRAVQAGPATPPQELLRAVQPETGERGAEKSKT